MAAKPKTAVPKATRQPAEKIAPKVESPTQVPDPQATQPAPRGSRSIAFNSRPVVGAEPADSTEVPGSVRLRAGLIVARDGPPQPGRFPRGQEGSAAAFANRSCVITSKRGSSRQRAGQPRSGASSAAPNVGRYVTSGAQLSSQLKGAGWGRLASPGSGII